MSADATALVGPSTRELIERARAIEALARAALERARLADADAARELDQARNEARKLDTSRDAGTVVRVVLDPDETTSMRLAAALHVRNRAGNVLRDVLPIAARLTEDSRALLKDARPAAGRLRLFFAGGKRRERAGQAVESLQRLVAWVDNVHFDRGLEEGLQRADLTWPPSQDVWSDVAARPRAYYDALANLLTATPSTSPDDHFLAADVVQDARRLLDLAPRLVEAEKHVTHQVKVAFEALRDRMVRRDLAQMPIGRVRDVTDGRLRLKTLQTAGFTTVQDVLDASVSQLQAVDGIGPQTAMQVHAAAQQLAGAVSDHLKFRVDLDPSDQLSTALITALRSWSQLRGPMSGMEADLEAATAELGPLRGVYLPHQGLVGLFSGRSSRGVLVLCLAFDFLAR